METLLVIADLFSEVPNGFSGGNIIDQNVNVNVNINVKVIKRFSVQGSKVGR